MRNLRKAAVLAAMVGSVSMLGAGAASADGHWSKGGDFSVWNPQAANCAYTDNTFTAPVNAVTGVTGADVEQRYGNVCAQTAPTFQR